MVLDHQKPLIFRSKFHWFFMFFQNRSRRPFLEGPGADLASTGRFWCHFRFSGFPKRRLLDTCFRQKGFEKVTRKVRKNFLPEPSLTRPWRHLRPNMDPRRSKTRFSSILDWFPVDFGPILSDFWPHFDTPWTQQHNPQHTTHNTQHHGPFPKKPWPGGMRVSDWIRTVPSGTLVRVRSNAGCFLTVQTSVDVCDV